jgi:hypothetical protein
MPKPPTLDDARLSLTAHVALKGREVQEKYGPRIGWTQVLQILEDREFVRYPCEIVFDAQPLLAGEPAHPVARGERPEDGFTLFVHPVFALQPDRIPYLALYQLVRVNYGEFASAEDAETFGAGALGLAREAYYQAVCALADEIT